VIFFIYKKNPQFLISRFDVRL